MRKNIFLVGLMGSGKTTVGRALARQLNCLFVDSDHEIESRTGASVPWIFEIEGEEGFRRREVEVIADLTSQRDIVLATGGGAVLDPENRAVLKSRGRVIYLCANVPQIMQRISRDKNRPLLQVEHPQQKLEQLFQQRDTLYREVADLIVETGRTSIQGMVQNIVKQLEVWEHQKHGQHDLDSETVESTNELVSSSVASVMLNMDLGTRSYPIVMGASLLSSEFVMNEYIPGSRVLVVTNTVVAPLYLDRLVQCLARAHKKVVTLVLPDGEDEKNWSNVMCIFDRLLREQCDRHTTLIALGGGVIGDMVGFAAASYMRGVPFVQVPTTLLAQVDSSVGGKTGINHPLGKNMIGAFYQPRAVLADVTTLNTLSDREFASGLAEVIKHAVIADTGYFDWLEQHVSQLLARDAVTLMVAIQRSCEIKAQVVQQDERETGVRAILNFGHTFAHAIELGLGYGTWLHGEAVGCGMVMAADLSCRLGFIDSASQARIKALVERVGLPIVAPNLGTARWVELMAVDKKNEGGQIKFVLLKQLGDPMVMAVPQERLMETLHACVGAS